MTRFSSTITSTGLVSAPRERVWPLLIDPDVLVRLTPLLAKVEADGDSWRWSMRRVGALGLHLTPVFTEQMSFDDGRRIAFTHQPPPGVEERTGADGWYELRDEPGGTHLAISVTVTVDLPLPRAAAPTVTAAMRATMSSMGDRFAANLERELRA